MCDFNINTFMKIINHSPEFSEKIPKIFFSKKGVVFPLPENFPKNFSQSIVPPLGQAVLSLFKGGYGRGEGYRGMVGR